MRDAVAGIAASVRPAVATLSSLEPPSYDGSRVSVKIYVPLESAGVDVWRPVRARPVAGGTYEILDQAYDRLGGEVEVRARPAGCV